jgi:hypothetical protein
MKTFTAAAAASLLLFATACGGDDGGSASGGGDFCDLFAATDAQMDALGGDDMPIDDPDAIETMFTTAIEGIENVSRSAPDELSDEFEILNDAYGKLLQKLKDADFDFFALANDPELAELMESSEVEAAQDTISEYTLEECGIDLDDDGTTDEGSTDEGSTDEGSTDEGSTDEGSTDEGSTDGGSTDETMPDVSIPLDGTEVEQITALYQSMFGLDDAQAGCLAEKVLALGGDAAEMTDVNEVMGMFADCDISMEDLSGGLSS